MCSGYMYRLNTVKIASMMLAITSHLIVDRMRASVCSAVGSRVMKGLSSGCTGYLFRNCRRRWAAYASPKTMPSQSRVLVIMCVSCQLCTLFIFTKPYQEAAPYQKNHADRILRRLPNITGSHARGADRIGDSGLVYQRLPTCRSGSNPAAGGLYQAPPPGNEDGYDTLL